jgi:hypothetical protein
MAWTTRQEAAFTEREVLDGITRAFWTDVWVREQEEKAERTGRRVPWGPGDEITDFVPRTVPATVRRQAVEFAGALKYRNHTNLYGLYLMAMNAPGRHTREPSAASFGWYLGMQGMGHGVSWFDDHPQFPIQIPHTEVYR